MPLALWSAPVTSVSDIGTFWECSDQYIIVYLIDLLVFRKDKDKCLKHAEEVLVWQRLRVVYVGKSGCLFMENERII